MEGRKATGGDFGGQHVCGVVLSAAFGGEFVVHVCFACDCFLVFGLLPCPFVLIDVTLNETQQFRTVGEGRRGFMWLWCGSARQHFIRFSVATQ